MSEKAWSEVQSTVRRAPWGVVGVRKPTRASTGQDVAPMDAHNGATVLNPALGPG
jgi:acyl dehydratase